MVLGLLLPGVGLREQLIKTAAGRLSISAGALALWKWLESGVEPVALDVFTKATGLLMLAQRGKYSSSLDCTSVCTLVRLRAHKHTLAEHHRGCSDVKSTILLPIEINKGL